MLTQTENKMKKAMIRFISNNFNMNEEKQGLNRLFMMADKNQNGMLSFDELYSTLKTYYGEMEAKMQVVSLDLLNLKQETIFLKQNLPKSQELSYDSFIKALISEKNYLSDKNLKKAFSLFYKVRKYIKYLQDGNNCVSAIELARVFGEAEEKWINLVKIFDKNHDGELEYSELKNLIMKFGLEELDNLKNEQKIKSNSLLYYIFHFYI